MEKEPWATLPLLMFITMQSKLPRKVLQFDQARSHCSSSSSLLELLELLSGRAVTEHGWMDHHHETII